MVQNATIPSENVALQACVSCKKQKRRCTKELPSCRLCIRLHKTCDYSESSSLSPFEGMRLLHDRIAELEARLGAANSSSTSLRGPRSLLNPFGDRPSTLSGASATSDRDCFTMFFLDNDVFRETRLTVPKPILMIPDDLADLIPSRYEFTSITNKYFNEPHQWLPFISKRRLELTVDMKADLVLLVVAMKMICTPRHAPDSLRTELYSTVKHHLSVFEACGMISIHTLQANILVAAYEMSHGVYPSAYLSPSKCARLGQALGLDNRQHAPQLSGKRPGAWAELEEYKRTWWAIMLLDRCVCFITREEDTDRYRFVNLGIGGHSLATDEPSKTDILPVDDSLWDKGEITTGQPLYMTSPVDIKAGSFARTCQAVNLLGRYIRHRNDHTSDASIHFQEAIQLHRTLVAFSNLLPDEAAQNPTQCGTAMALCYTTLLHLCDPYACTEAIRGEHCTEEIEMQTTAIAALKSTSADVLDFTGLVDTIMDSRPDAVSPLMAECLYQGASTYAWLVHETGSEQNMIAYRRCVLVLEKLDNRWAVAGEYLKILEKTREILYDNNPMLSTTQV